MAGETSLARQLKKLAVPQTSVLIQDKIRKSFLFDHRDAAGLDREIIFAFGTTGLQKLSTINPLFSKFEANLFSLTYKDFQRSVQTKEVNEKLNAKISEFLRMLSPYFLIRDAHEALEWLIYRFHIHLYNVDELMASVIPHYNTSTFVRVVQLLELDNNSRWVWLKPVQKSGVHLEYSALLNRFLSDASFRKFICDIAPNVLSVYKDHEKTVLPIISFSMTTMYNALENDKLVDDSLVTFMFPYILNGLSSDLSKYTYASYMVISKLISSIKLTPDIVEKFLIRIFKNLKEDIFEEACEILLLAYQLQSIEALPKIVFSKLLSADGDCAKIVFPLLNEFEASKLIKAILRKTMVLLFKTASPTKELSKKMLLKFPVKFIKSVSLERAHVFLIFNMLVKRLVKCFLRKNAEKTLFVVKRIFKNLELIYPDHFDAAYKLFLEKKSKGKKHVSKFISNSICDVKYEVVSGVETPLALGLNHGNSEIRETSVNYFLKLVTKREFNDLKFIENALNERLYDKNPNVVLAVLSSADILVQILGKSKIMSAFQNIFARRISIKSDWYPVHMKCLGIMTKFFSDKQETFDFLEIILNFLFPVNKHTIEGLMYLLKSDLENDFLMEMKSLKPNVNNKELTSEELFRINCEVILSLKKFIGKMNQESLKMYSSFLNSKIIDLRSKSLLVFHIYAVYFMMTSSTDKENSVLFMNDLLQVFQYCITRSILIQEKFEVLSDEGIIRKYVDSLNKKELSSSLICSVFYKIITGYNLDALPKSWSLVDYDYEHSYTILSRLFNFCILYTNSSNEILKEYFRSMLPLLISHQLKDIQTTFWFLSTKWLNSSENFLVRYTALNIAIALCKTQNQMDWIFNDSMIFFSILKIVGHPSSELRHSALTLLLSCLNAAKNCTHSLKFLGEEVFAKSEEIKIDFRQCFDYVGNWFREVIENTSSQKSGSKQSKNNLLHHKNSVLNEMLNLLKQEIPVTMKSFLLSCLQNVDDATILSSCIPVLYSHIRLLEKDKNEDILKIIQLLISKFTPKTAVNLTDDSEASKCLLHCLNCVIHKGNEVDRCVQTFTLDILSNKLFSSIPSLALQQKIFDNLLTLYMESCKSVEKVLRELFSHAYLFVKHLQDKELTTSKSTTLREAKKTKILENNPEIFESGIWKKITVFLELIQGESNLLKIEILIPELFNLLHKSLDYDIEKSEYVKQLILLAIHNCCEQLSPNAYKQLESHFRVELIICCIRSSKDPKTHNRSLLLLNLAASMFPDYVQKNLMPIFVFMGSSLVRQDDSYSFQVISQTIETIVPSLLEASNKQTETDGYQVVASVIRDFVDSLLDIPGHRQLPLFTKLITTLDPSKYLWIPLGQICDQYATAFHDIVTRDNNNWKVSPTLEFAVNLHKQFSPDIQIDTCINLVNFLLTLPDTKKQYESNPEKYKKIKEPFDAAIHNDKQLQIYKHNVLTYIKIWLSSQAFLNQVSELSVKQQNYLEEKYESLLESVLVFLQAQLNLKNVMKDNLELNNQVELLYDLVQAINSLLPCDLFIKVIGRLIKHNEEEIQARAIELLITKLEQQRELLYVENHNSFLKLLKPLLKLVNKYSNETDKNSKSAVIQQTALYALHLLCKLIGSEYPTKFYKVLNVSVTILGNSGTPELMVNALLCLAQLCHCLNVDILPHLKTFMPVILNILSDKKTINMSECLILGIVTALHSIIQNLGIFLSSYMKDIIINTCIHSVNYSELNKKNIYEKFENLQVKLAKEIPLRVLINAVESAYTRLAKKNAKAIVPLMKILTESLDYCKHEDTLSCATQLQNFYMSSLDFRNSNQTLPLETLAVIENSIISSLQTFVMKLSVTGFRIFFQKIYQWTTVSIDDQEQKQRVFTFYKLTSEFSKSLKSLFSLMSKYFFNHISSILVSCNASKSKILYFDGDAKMSQELLLNVLDTLNYCFMYSDQQLLDKESFDLLMQPIVDQIENLSDEAMYQELIENHLNSCIAYFMTSISDSAMWKALNYQILLKTRHDLPKVRFGALQIILEVVNKMADNYLVLLPESIPFLAELMEDESSEVEQECQTVIVEMEKILGEPIRNYF